MKNFIIQKTALLKVLDDITLNIDQGIVTALMLLDLYTAFDTIDYNTLIERLYIWYGILGTTMTRLSSYLIDFRL